MLHINSKFNIQHSTLYVLPFLLLSLVFYSEIAYGSAGGEELSSFPVFDTHIHKQEAVVTASSSAGIVVAGYTMEDGNPDYMTVKFDNNGNLLWRAKTQNTNDGRVKAVAVDSGHNVIVTGFAFNMSNNSYDIRTIKYNGATGAVIWDKSFSRTTTTGDSATALALDSSDNVYVGGYTQGNNTDDDFVIIKYNGADGSADTGFGNQGKTFYDLDNVNHTNDAQRTNGFVSYNHGDDDDVVAERIKSIVINDTAADANYRGIAATGESWGGSTNFDVLTVKFNLAGVLKWSHKPVPSAAELAGYDLKGADQGYLVKMDPTGDVYVAGYIINGSNNKDVYILKLNGDTGAKIWQKVIDKGYEEQPRDMFVNGGYLYLTSNIYSMTTGADFYTIKLDKGTGILKWAATLNTTGSNDDGPVSMIYDNANGNLFIAGYTQSTANGFDILTVKYKDNTDDAQLIWTKTYNGVTGSATTCGSLTTQVTCETDQPIGISLASDGNIFVAGWTDRTPALAIGKATGGSAATLVDTTRAASWTTANQWKGHYLMMTSGLNAGLERKITAYDTGTQTLTVSAAFTGGVIASGDTYFIYDKPGAADSRATAAGTTTSLTDSGKSWPSATGLFWKDYTIMMVTGPGANPGTTKVISGNTATGLNWSPGFGSSVALNNQYFIYNAQDTDFFVIKYDAGTVNRPTNLTAAYVTSESGNKIALGWKDNSSNEQRFMIQRRVQGGTYTDGNARTYYPGAGAIVYDNSIALNEQDVRYYYRAYACGTWDGSVCGDLSQPSDETSALATSLYTPMPSWMYLYSSDSMGDEEATSISFGPDNNPVATGSSNYDTWNHYYTIKFDRSVTTDKANDTGVVTSATPTTITDNKRTTSATSIRTTWANNQWNGAYVTVNRNDTVNPYMTRQVSGNTADTITVSSAFPATVTAGDTYFLYAGGTVASGTTTSLTDTSAPAKNWTSNQWINYYVTLKKAAGYQRRKITGNGINSLTVTEPFSEDPATGDTYVIEPAIWKGGATYLTSTGGSQSRAVAVDVDNSNNVAVTGYASTSGTDNDIFTIKYSGAGENDTIGLSFGTLSHLWFDAEKFYVTRDINKHDYPVALAVNKSVNGTGEVAVIGYGLNCSGTSARPAGTTFQGTAHAGTDCASAIYNKDIYIMKYPNCSNAENMCPASWATVYNGTGNGDDVPSAAAFDEYGNIYITGYTQTAIVQDYPLPAGTSASVVGGTASALSVDGTPWGVDDHKFRHLLVMTGNNAGLRRKITSNTQNTLTFEAFPSEIEGVIDGHPVADTFRIVSDNYEFFTAKLDRYTGNTVWSRKLSDDYPAGTASPNNYTVYGDAVSKALALDPDGNVWVTGTVTNSSGATSICAIKYSGSTGAMLNTGLKCSASNALGNDEATAVKIHDYDKSAFVLGTVLTGTNDHDIYLTKYDADSGEVAGWPKVLKRPDTDDYAVAMAISPGGEFSVAGNTVEQGVSKILAIKYYFDGTILGSNIYTRGTSDSATSVGVNYRGEAFVTGRSANKYGDNDYVVFRTSGISSMLPSPAPFTATALPGATGAHGIMLSWDTSGMPVDGTLRYKIEKADAAVTPLVWSDVKGYADNFTAATLTVDSLPQKKKYCYRLTARTGTDAPYSESLPLGTCPTTTLDPPALSGVTALNASSINISWAHIDSNIAYKIERKISSASWPGTVVSGDYLEQDYPGTSAPYTPFNDTGLTPGTSYDYRLYVRNVAGDSLPSAVLTAITSPATPTILNVYRPASGSDTQLNVSWAHMSGNTGYTLIGSKNSDCSTTDSTIQIAQSASGTVIGTATGLTSATMYYFKVRAKSNALDGGSAYSDCFATGVRTKLSPPVIISALGKAGTTNTITLSWSDPNSAPSNETGFTIHHEVCKNDGPTSAGGCNPNAAPNTDWNHSSGTTLTAGANQTSKDITGLTAGRTYKFSLHADNSVNTETVSNESAYSTGTANLPTPANFRYIAVTDTYIDVSWNNIIGETNFLVEIRKSTGPGTWTGWETAKTTVSTCNALAINTSTVRVNAGCPVGSSAVGNITTNSTYELRLKGSNSLNTSAYTSAITVQTTPAAPTMLGAVAKSASSIEFSWQTDPTHTGYIISRRSSACDGTTTGFSQIAAFPVNDPFTVNATSGTSADVNYWNQQGAAFWGGTSDWAPPVSISDATNGSIAIDAASATGAVRISTTSKTTGIALSWNEAVMRQTRNATHMLPSGDFDMQLDFNLPDGQFASTVKTNTYLRMVMLFGTGNWADLVLIDRYVNASGNYYYTEVKVNNVITQAAPASSAISAYGGPGTPEKFRVTRKGDVFTTYYWDGTQWVTFLSKAVPEFNGQSPYSIELHQYAAQANGEVGNLTLTTDIDNFKILNSAGLFSDANAWTPSASSEAPGTAAVTNPTPETLRLSTTNSVSGSSVPNVWNSATAYMKDPAKLSGDFDVQVDFNLTAPAAASTDKNLYARLRMDFPTTTGTNIVHINRIIPAVGDVNGNGGNNIYRAAVSLRGAWTSVDSLPLNIGANEGNSGKLRIARIGSTINMYYLDNVSAPAWTLLTTVTDGDMAKTPTSVELRQDTQRTQTNPFTAQVDFSNFQLGSLKNSYLDTGLAQGTKYCYSVSFSSTANPSYSTPGMIDRTTFPAIPTFETVVSGKTYAISQTKIHVSWNNVTGETGYTVKKAGPFDPATTPDCSSNPDNGGIWSALGSTGTDVTGIDTANDLTEGQKYCFKVKSYNSDGTQGYGNPIVVATKLSAPANLKLYGISQTHIKLSWDYNSLNNGYKIYSATTVAATAGNGYNVGDPVYGPSPIVTKAKQTSGPVTQIDGSNPQDAVDPVHNSSGLSKGTKYYYKVCTLNADSVNGPCTGILASYGTTTPNYPSYKTSPSVLSIPLSDTQIQVSWNPASAATGYKIQFKQKAAQGTATCNEGTSPWAGITEESVNGTIKTYDSLSEGVRYCTQIKSVIVDSSWPRDDSESGYGTVNRLTTKLIAPSLNASSVSTSSISLSWANNTAGAGNTGYIVQRRTPCGTGNWSTAPGGDLDGRSTVYTSYADSGLSLGTAYEYQLLIKNADYYNDGSASFDLSEPSSPICLTTTPSEPSRSLSVRAVAPTQIALTWQTSLGATKYTVERKRIAPSTTEWTAIAGLTDKAAGYSTSYCGWYSYATPSCSSQIASYYATLDTDILAMDSEYCYRVKAGNLDGGYSALYSNTSCARTPSLGTPSNISVTALSSRQIQISWNYSGATPDGFEIESTTNPGGGKWSVAGTVNGSTFTFMDKSGIQPSTASLPAIYYYRIRAYKAKTIDTTSDIYKIKSDSWTARGILQTGAAATTNYYSPSAISGDYTQTNGYGLFNVSPDAAVNNKFRFNTKGLNSSTYTNYSGLDMNNPGLLTGDFDFKVTYKILEPTPTSITVTNKIDYIVFINMYFPGIGNSVLVSRYVKYVNDENASQCLGSTGCYFTRAFFGNFNNNKRVGTADVAWDTVGKLRIKRVGSMIYMYGGPTFDTLINSNIYSSEAPTAVTIYQSVLPPAGTTVEMKADITIEPIAVTEKSFYSSDVLPCDTPTVHAASSCTQMPVWTQADDKCD